MQAHNLRTFALVALIMAVGADDLEKYCLQPEELLEAEAEHLALASSCAGEYFYAGIIQVAENSGDPGLDFEGGAECRDYHLYRRCFHAPALHLCCQPSIGRPGGANRGGPAASLSYPAERKRA
jgi:hypothetical protein